VGGAVVGRSIGAAASTGATDRADVADREDVATGHMLPIGQKLPIGQMLPIGKALPIGQMLLIRKMLPIGQMLPIGRMLPIEQKLPIGKILPMGPAPGICASAHDIYVRHGVQYSRRPRHAILCTISIPALSATLGLVVATSSYKPALFAWDPGVEGHTPTMPRPQRRVVVHIPQP
jgi:hypothetical protein